MRIFLPQYGARISGVASSEKRVNIVIDRHKGLAGELVVMGCFRCEGRMIHREKTVSGRRCNFDLPSRPTDAYIVVLGGEKREFLCEWSGGENEIKISEKSSMYWLKMVQQGEGEKVEFKHYANPVKPDEPYLSLMEARDLAKEFVAFANSEGGMVILGVDDEGEICGVDEPRKVADKVSQVAVGSCIPPVPVRIESRRVGEMVILVVIVEPGDKLFLRKKDMAAYVRSGATSRRAGPREIEEIVRVRDGNGGG